MLTPALRRRQSRCVAGRFASCLCRRNARPGSVSLPAVAPSSIVTSLFTILLLDLALSSTDDSGVRSAARFARSSGKPVLLCVTKVDHEEDRDANLLRSDVLANSVSREELGTIVGTCGSSRV